MTPQEKPKGRPVTARCQDGRVFIIPGWPVTIHRLEEFKFWVHKSIEQDELWTVSEEKTGMVVAVGDSLDGAVFSARRRTQDITPTQLHEVIKRGLQKAREAGHAVELQ